MYIDATSKRRRRRIAAADTNTHNWSSLATTDPNQRKQRARAWQKDIALQINGAGLLGESGGPVDVPTPIRYTTARKCRVDKDIAFNIGGGVGKL